MLNPTIRLLMVRLLLEHGAKVNVTNERGETPLHYAIHLKRKDLVFTLLSEGANPHLKGKENAKTAYEIAKLENSVELITLIDKVEELQIWLEQIQMGKYLKNFVREKIFMNMMPFVSDKVLQEIGIENENDQKKLLEEILQLQPVKIQDNDNKIHFGRRKGPTIIDKLQTKTRELSTSTSWIKFSELEFTERLGSGTSGEVFSGLLFKEPYENEGKPVAIKVIEKDKQNSLEEFEYEFKIMSEVSGPNILHLFGATIEPKLCLVMELCTRGSLYDLLNDTSYVLTWKEILRFCTEMVKGIQLLHNHEPQILHRDLKSMNFLISEDWVLKVSDFGLSRFLTSANMITLYEVRGTMAYCAPETFTGKMYTAASDIYSLGIIMWEMLARMVTGTYQRPFEEYSFITKPIQLIIQTSQNGLRPTIPENESSPPLFISLIQACWDQDSLKRPSLDDILNMLEMCKQKIFF